jgi:cytochrome oxidase Cu insertion factor (SCO1/SenC/PrrC family)
MPVLLAMLLLFMGFPDSSARAQGVPLGPRDGATLAQTDTGRVKVGAEAPDFTLESLAGPPITLSQFRGKQNVVLVFYRGFW